MSRSDRQPPRAVRPSAAAPNVRQPRKHLRKLDAATDDVRGATDIVTMLRAVRGLREAADELERSTVEDAREAGITWMQIGEVYGLSKQGAQQRFRRS